MARLGPPTIHRIIPKDKAVQAPGVEPSGMEAVPQPEDYSGRPYFVWPYKPELARFVNDQLARFAGR